MHLVEHHSIPYRRTVKSAAFKRDIFIKASTAVICLIAFKCFGKLSYLFTIPLGELFLVYKHKTILIPGVAIAFGLFFCAHFNPTVIDPIRQTYYFIFMLSYLSFIVYVIIKVIERLFYGKNCYRNAHRLLD